jgi:hypothetical protein
LQALPALSILEKEDIGARLHHANSIPKIQEALKRVFHGIVLCHFKGLPLDKRETSRGFDAGVRMGELSGGCTSKRSHPTSENPLKKKNKKKKEHLRIRQTMFFFFFF